MGDNHPEMGITVRVSGRITNYHEAGAGPPVLLLHGSGPGVSAWSNWRSTLPALGKSFRVLAPDVVGFGFTETPPDLKFDTDMWAQHVIGFLDALDVPAAHLLGNSFGGALAAQVAVRHPERVNRLVLVGSVATRFPLTEELDAVWGYTPSFENMRDLMSIFMYDSNQFDRDSIQLRLDTSQRPGRQEAFARLFPAPRQRWVDALASPEAELAALRHRVLIVQGRDDRVVPMRASLQLHTLIERSELHLFGACGHWPHVEHAERFNQLVTDFLLAD
ncbi:MAG: alpha/beta fold hydrolase [Gammaproteobacteria bacterium]|nr:alpha/beta fold hydrolase [Gammaproteobacteria bacterium]